MIVWRTNFSSIWIFWFMFCRLFCLRIFCTWPNWSCIFYLLFVIIFILVLQLCVHNLNWFQNHDVFFIFFSTHIDNQYWAFAFNFIVDDNTNTFFALNVNLSKMLKIKFNSLKLIIIHNFSIVSYCFMKRNYLSWFFRVKKNQTPFWHEIIHW